MPGPLVVVGSSEASRGTHLSLSKRRSSELWHTKMSDWRPAPNLKLGCAGKFQIFVFVCCLPILVQFRLDVGDIWVPGGGRLGTLACPWASL